MQTWFNCRVVYMEQTPEGELKQVTKTFLMDAVNFTEAEKRTLKHLEVLAVEGSDVRVVTATKTKIAEVIGEKTSNKWYSTKISYITVEDDKEKKVKADALIAGETLTEALNALKESLKGMLVPYEILELKLSPIVEVVPYKSEE